MAPVRVVSLLAYGTEIVRALGCGEWLVGPDPCADLLPAEALVALRPDVILTPALAEEGVWGAREAERAAGRLPSRPRIVPLGAATLADLWRDLRSVADALGVPERGVQLVTRLRARIEAVAARAAGHDVRPRVACIASLEPLASAGHWTRELVAMAGGEGLFGVPDKTGSGGSSSPPLAWEELVAADPDVIFVAPRGLGLARTRAEMAALAARPGWSALKAVREGRVFLGDGSACFARPGPRVAEALEVLAEALQPRAFRFGHEGRGWERWRAAQPTAVPAPGAPRPAQRAHAPGAGAGPGPRRDT